MEIITLFAEFSPLSPYFTKNLKLSLNFLGGMFINFDKSSRGYAYSVLQSNCNCSQFGHVRDILAMKRVLKSINFWQIIQMGPDLHSRNLVFQFFLQNPANPKGKTIITMSTKQLQTQICINNASSLKLKIQGPC